MIEVFSEKREGTFDYSIRAIVPQLDIDRSSSIMREVVFEMCKGFAQEWLQNNETALVEKLATMSDETLGAVVKELLIEKLTTKERVHE